MATEDAERDGVSIVYKMKVVQFLNRSVPIILQNDNGPCPLLAISNVLLLRNNVTLGLDMVEISQRELMSLVAEWLLDTNCNIQNQDDEFVKNQQQNIGDAIQLLPRLATGIDVNVRFRHIHDFEFTPECAIFDLFHVGLVHGWLCDPQDEVTFRVIGSNSYNILVEKLVAIQAIKTEQAYQSAAVLEDETSVDFPAATLVALGVPSPECSKILTEEDFVAMNQVDGKSKRKGDEEEAAELLQALQLSETDIESTLSCLSDGENASSRIEKNTPVVQDGISHVELTSVVYVDKDGVDSLEVEREVVISQPKDNGASLTSQGAQDVLITSILHVQKEVDSSDVTEEVLEQEFVLTPAEYGRNLEITDPKTHYSSVRLWMKTADGAGGSGKEILDVALESTRKTPFCDLETSQSLENMEFPDTCENFQSSPLEIGEDVKTNMDQLVLLPEDIEGQTLSVLESLGSSFEHIPLKEDKISVGTPPTHLSEVADCVSSGLDIDEPLYEEGFSLGEAGIASGGDKEPVYEGDGFSGDLTAGLESEVGKQQEDRKVGDENLSVDITEGLLIENFLSSTASQLTYHGLFSLQEGLKNNELFVFFRNNHFSTLFKYEGQIYLLATDQGYLSQPDLVWEKLTEVDGDTVFATGNFEQFQLDQNPGTWNERDAVAATADYMSLQQIGGASTDGASYNSDLQLAMALQQQELSQQQQESRAQSSSSRSTQPNAKISSIGAGHLFTGPARSNIAPPKQEKAKDKCTIM